MAEADVERVRKAARARGSNEVHATAQAEQRSADRAAQHEAQRCFTARAGGGTHDEADAIANDDAAGMSDDEPAVAVAPPARRATASARVSSRSNKGVPRAPPGAR